ncbi:MAG: DNA polymerase III subunit chi [Lysobacteraceae bacterium]
MHVTGGARADFYLLASERFRNDPLRVVCVLVKRAFESGAGTLLLARDLRQAEALDDALWAWNGHPYLPHQIAGSDDDDCCPILIAAPGQQVAPRGIQINLRDTPVERVLDRVLEIIPADEDAREPLRDKWRLYKSWNIALSKHDM